MELEPFQAKVAKLTESWQEPKIEWLMMLLTEELGELIQAIRKSQGNRWGHEGEPVTPKEDIVEELGDMLFLMARASLVTGVDLGVAAASVVKKMELRVAESG